MNVYKRLGKRISMAKESFREEEKERKRILPKFEPIEMVQGLSEEELLERAIEKLKNVNEFVPLIRMSHRGSKRVVVQGNIKWDGKKLIYNVIEPELSPLSSDVFSSIRSKKFDEYNTSIKELNKIAKKRNLSVSEVLAVQYQIFKYLRGAGKIEPLLHDSNIDIIECGKRVRVKHKDPLFDWIDTDIILNSADFDLIHERVKNDDKIRVWFDNVFKIKKFDEIPMSIVDLMRDGLVSREILAYLWFCMENGMSICIAGTSSSGTTSLMQGLDSLLHPSRKVSTAEKSPEMRLDRDNWKPFISENLFDSVKNSLKEKSDYTFVNDVEGEEAYLLFQAMDAGYPVIFTAHYENKGSVFPGLKNNIPDSLIESLDILIFNIVRKKGGKLIRRVAEISEVLNYDRKSKEVITNPAFRWDPSSDDFIPIKSVLLEKIGKTEDEVKQDLERKVKLLKSAEKTSDIKNRLFR